MRFLCLLVFSLLCAVLYFAFPQFISEILQNEDSMARIEKSMEKKEWVQAEKLLVDYLRIEMDMHKSWQAWVLLVNVSQKANLQDTIILSYLDDMLIDYSNDPEKKKFILLHIAQIKERQNNEQEAINALVSYTNLPNLNTAEAFEAYNKLLSWYLKMGNFSAAEDILHNCLSLPLEDAEMAFCLYTLAEIYAGKSSFETAHELLYQLNDLEIDAYLLSQVNFLHGDILEQQRKYSEALVYFRLALEMYGNKAVVQKRIAALEKRLPKKSK